MTAVVDYWTKGEPEENFGDLLTLLFLDSMDLSVNTYADAEIRLVGSVICDWVIEMGHSRPEPASPPSRIIFWGCGLRSSLPISPHLLEKCVFLGVRGPLSRTFLDLPADTPMGDTALLLPRVYTPERDSATEGKVVCVPHFKSRLTDYQARALSGAEVVLSSRLPGTVAACRTMIDQIASAGFVMANSLHAAIVALAYDVPFAFWAADYIDLPFKWVDFASSVNIDCEFHHELAAGQRWYEQARATLTVDGDQLDRLLEIAPFPLKAAAAGGAD